MGEFHATVMARRRKSGGRGRDLRLPGRAAGAGRDTGTEWGGEAIVAASPRELGERESAIVNLAMFDAVNSVEQRYQPYLVKLAAASPTSPEAAAASAAAAALAGLHPESAASFKAALSEYLAHLN